MNIKKDEFWVMSDDLYKTIRETIIESDDINKDIILEELYIAQYIEETNEHLISPTLHKLIIPYVTEHIEVQNE